MSALLPLRNYQRAALDAVREILMEVNRPAIVLPTGGGKGHPLDTDVPTPDGWRKWGDLKPGDLVYGSGGTPTRVSAVYDRGTLATFRVGFSDGTSVVVDGDHLWRVKDATRRRTVREWATLTTDTLARTDLRLTRGYRWHVPMARPVERSHAELTIDPYVVGALLANGCLTGSGTMLTTPDRDVAARVAQSTECNRIADTTDVCERYSLPGLTAATRTLGMRVKSAEKRIPSAYLAGSIEQRVALLHGLMDGDGSARDAERRSVSYHTLSPDLARDVAELVTSLGGTAGVAERLRADGKPTEYKVGILLPAGIEPFSSARKSFGGVRSVRNLQPRRAIVSIEPAGDAPIRCISVDAPDHLYLITRHHIVTHNTVVFAHQASEWLAEHPGTRVLVLVHTEELVQQAKAKILSVAPHLVVGIVKAKHNEVTADVIVASVQTLRNAKRRNQIQRVSLVIVDECFPAGTLVGGRPIESLRPGDLAPSWDEATGREVLRPVVALMKSVPSAMVRVTFDDGTDLTCTPNHPVLTMDGWWPAGALSRGESVVSFTHDANARGDVHGVPEASNADHESQDRHVPPIGPDVLRGRVPGCMGEAGPIGADGTHEQGARVRADDGAQPDALAGGPGEDVRHAPADQPQATGARREREWAHRTASEACNAVGLANGGDDRSEGWAASAPLLGGHSAPDHEGLRRGGRGVTLLAGTPSLRPEAGRKVALRRVARVQDLQPGRDGTYGGSCPDGHVYNVEVAGTHTYLVGREGVVAHNCHHATAATYRAILEHFGCMGERIDGQEVWTSVAPCPAIGFTATLARGDGGPLGQIWQRVAFSRDIAWMIRKGYLIPPRGKRIEVPELDLSKVKKSGGDFAEGALGEALVGSLAPEIIAKAYLEHASDRKALAFFPTVASAEVAVQAFLDQGVGARVIHGGMSPQERAETLAWHRRGTVLINCMILTEGFDDPEVDCIIMARPTKSKPLYIQIVGRGLRVDTSRPYAEQDCLLMDVVGVTARMDLRSMADLSDKDVKEPKDGQTILDLEDEFDSGEGIEEDPEEHYVGPVEVRDFDPLAAKSSRAWNKTAGGTYFLPAGKGAYVFLVELPDGWAVAWANKTNSPYVCPLSAHDDECTPRHGKRGALTEHRGMDLEMAMTWGEDLAVDMGSDPMETLTKKAAPWRKKPASSAAKGMAQGLGIAFPADIKAGELSDQINKIVGSRRIDPVANALVKQAQAMGVAA